MSTPKKQVTFEINDYSKLSDKQIKHSIEKYTGRMVLLKSGDNNDLTSSMSTLRSLFGCTLNLYEIMKEATTRIENGTLGEDFLEE